MANIDRSDLGLFVTFEALMQERSVTRAAARLGLSQPATSACLRRLRDLTGDPLFLRTGRGLHPTAHALQLVGPVGDALASLRRSLSRPEAFDPRITTRRFTLMLSDIGELIYPAPLLARIAQEAPGVSITVRRLVAARLAPELARGTVDLAVGYVRHVPDGIAHQRLFDEAFVCAHRLGHPRIHEPLTLERYLSERHLLIARPVGDEDGMRPLDGEVTARLAAIAREREVGMTMPHFLPAPMVVGATDLLLTLPRKLGEVFCGPARIGLLPLPFEVPLFPVSVFWHERFEVDPGRRWLRALLARLFGQSGAGG